MTADGPVLTATTPIAMRRELERRLSEAGVEDAAADARQLVRVIVGREGSDPLLDDETVLDEGRRKRLSEAFAQRLQGRPLAQILGSQGFWTLDLAVTPDVLVPRPDTEHVVEALLAANAPENARILDLGVGSGAILLSVLSERLDAFGVGVDRSRAALAVARTNAQATGLQNRCAFVNGDWDAALSGRFDLIACNPPYVRSADIETLQREVRDHEPRLALDGGSDGLVNYRYLAARIADLLTPDGVAAFEVGAGQASSVKKLFTDAGLSVEVRQDLLGHDRVVEARAAEVSPKG